MNFDTTDCPREEDEDFIVAQTRAFNVSFTENDVRSLCVFVRAADGRMIGGLTGKTYWRYLDISFLWVHEQHRNAGVASKLMALAESEAEARARGCAHVLLDTFSFQALGFYRKLGYEEFGQLPGFSGKHVRHYLRKMLGEPSA